MAIQIPTDASLGVQKALGDLEDWLYRIQDRLDKAPTPDDVDRRISEAIVAEPKQLGLDFNDVFRGGDAHSLGHVPDPGVYGNSGPRYLTTDGEWAPLLDGALVSGDPGVGGSSLAQKVVEVHGSLAVTGALQADTIYFRQLTPAQETTGLTTSHLDDGETLIQVVPHGECGTSLAQRYMNVMGSVGVLGSLSAETLRSRELAVTGSVVGNFSIKSEEADQPIVTLTNTHADESGGYFDFFKASASPAADDQLGSLRYRGLDSAGNVTTFANIRGYAATVTDGSEDGKISFLVNRGGTVAERVSITNVLNAPMIGARVYRTANLSIADATVTAVTFTAASYDTNSFWSAGSGTRLTIPTGLAGYYHFEANISWASTNTRAIVQIELNAAGSDDATKILCKTDSSLLSQHVSGTLYLNAGDYIECFVYQDSTGAVNLTPVGSVNHGTPSFSLFRIGV